MPRCGGTMRTNRSGVARRTTIAVGPPSGDSVRARRPMNVKWSWIWVIAVTARCVVSSTVTSRSGGRRR